MKGRITLGLYNSYDRTRLREAHRRALLRASSLAWAFDLHVATFSFPFGRFGGDLATARGGKRGGSPSESLRFPLDIASFIDSTTSVGEGRGLLEELAKEGRFHIYPSMERGFPPQHGTPILTTSHPHPSRSVTLEELSSLLLKGKSVLLIFGLGPKGTPKEISEKVEHEFDVTHKGAPLETAVALGAVVGALVAYGWARKPPNPPAPRAPGR